jgi:hypothetical protein
MNRNRTTTRPASTGHDPVLWLMITACAVLAIAGLLMAHRMVADARAQSALNCPAPDHPVWASTLNHGHGMWICGESITIGVKSR